MKTLRYLLISLRPAQWLKNLVLFAALILGGGLFDSKALGKAAQAAIIFCGVSAAMYLINDVVDAPKDRSHPTKRLRPIASRKISPRLAIVTALLLLATSLPFSLQLGQYFFVLTATYILLQLAYSFHLRNIIILDALTVATGFTIRVFAGAVAIPTSISSWLILTTIGLSLLLAFGKRRGEKTLLATASSPLDQALNIPTRGTLRHYPEALLDTMLSTSASLTILAYALFTFHTSPTYTSLLLVNILPPNLITPKWMMLTIPVVIYGISRYLYIIYEKMEGEAPEKTLLTDKPLALTVLLWILLILVFVYGLG